MSDIRWEDPPAPGRQPAGIWIERLQPLTDHPKRWAVIAIKPNANTAKMTAHDLKHSRFIMPTGRWEFRAGTVDGEHRVYARYLGPDEDGAQ